MDNKVNAELKKRMWAETQNLPARGDDAEYSKAFKLYAEESDIEQKAKEIERLPAQTPLEYEAKTRLLDEQRKFLEGVRQQLAAVDGAQPDKQSGVDAGLSKNRILAAPWQSIRGVKADIEKLLSDGRAAWIQDARVGPRGRRGGGSSRWNPAKLGFAMTVSVKGRKWMVNYGVMDVFIREHFKEYVGEWDICCEYRE